jgi:hypothetical protein
MVGIGSRVLSQGHMFDWATSWSASHSWAHPLAQLFDQPFLLVGCAVLVILRFCFCGAMLEERVDRDLQGSLTLILSKKCSLEHPLPSYRICRPEFR